MSVIYSAGKSSIKTVLNRNVKDVFINITRNRYPFKESRLLGFYNRVIPVPVYKERENKYRKEVLRPLEEIPSLEERLRERNALDPVLDKKINIGFAEASNKKVSVKDRLAWRKEMGKKIVVDENEITKIDLDAVDNDTLNAEGFSALQNIAEHYGIFDHLYQHGFFTPCLPLRVTYDYDEEFVTPVFNGNIIQASEASKTPSVYYESNPDDLWTLLLTNLDGHLLNPDSEYLHWFVGNIKGNDLSKAEVICDYLQPFPMRGSGYHRLVFVLYKQEKEIDFSALKRKSPCLSLEERTFKTFDFYKEYQDHITPAGLAFFQSTWDEKLTDFFHNKLNMQEPVFEYIVPPVYYRPQVQYPHLQPFNIYLDRYRDPKEIKKEVLLKRLQNVHPFEDETPMPKYPCLHRPKRLQYSWQRQDIRLERLRLGKYRDLRPASVYPQEDSMFPYRTKA